MSPLKHRLTTFVLKYPRFIHSEFMTHRLISKNAASSRAIPFERMCQMVLDEIALPEYWGAEQKGMQSGAQLDYDSIHLAQAVWDLACVKAVDHAQRLAELGVHKSLCNRLLEPFAHMTVIATGDHRGWANFFALRAHRDAQPEFQVLAYRMLDQYLASVPRSVAFGEWHVPYDLTPEDRVLLDDQSVSARLKVATGRIARVSYLTHDGARSPHKDIELYDRLVTSTPPHMSPFEHCACPTLNRLGDVKAGNFGHHWLQYRKLHANEHTRSMLDAEMAERITARATWISLPSSKTRS